MSEICTCGHWQPEHFATVRGRKLIRYRPVSVAPLDTTKPLAAGQCVWCLCNEYAPSRGEQEVGT